MTLTEEEKRVLNTSFLLHHGEFSQDIAKSVYKASLTQMKENYDSKNEKTKIVIPFVGTLIIIYDGEEEVYDNKDNKVKTEAKVTCLFSPSKEIKRYIGDLVDGNPTSIEKKIYREIETNLRKKIANK